MVSYKLPRHNPSLLSREGERSSLADNNSLALFTTYLPNILIIVVAVQIWEEGGWSGFAVPTLQQRFGAKRGEIMYAV